MRNRPLVLLNCDVEADKATLRLNYAEAVRAAGGSPLVLPPARETDGATADALARADAVLLVGANDYDPALYGERPHPRVKLVDPRRQASDLDLARAALEAGIPVLGICGGAQLLAVVTGGACIQHLGPDDGASPHADGTRHGCAVEPGSLLARVLGSVRLEVNSHHHQAVDPDRPGTMLRVCARAEPPVRCPGSHAAQPFVPAVEALEAADGAPVLAVQWHPERMLDEPAGLPLLRWLVGASGEPRQGAPRAQP